MLRFSTCLLCLFSCLTAEEDFLLINGPTNDVLFEFGSHVDEQVSPCSTFKIPLSLMGFDTGVLIDENTPEWDYQEGYDNDLKTWEASIDPQQWMSVSCIWYSKIIAIKLEAETFQDYLAAFVYGNQDSSGENPVWINSSLKISPREQLDFICKMLQGKLSVSDHAIEMTKAILFKEELGGWRLYGKTGWSGSHYKLDGVNEIGWFVGWLENDEGLFFPIAYQIREPSIDLAQRIPRVKQLLIEAYTKTIGN